MMESAVPPNGSTAGLLSNCGLACGSPMLGFFLKETSAIVRAVCPEASRVKEKTNNPGVNSGLSLPALQEDAEVSPPQRLSTSRQKLLCSGASISDSAEENPSPRRRQTWAFCALACLVRRSRPRTTRKANGGSKIGADGKRKKSRRRAQSKTRYPHVYVSACARHEACGAWAGRVSRGGCDMCL